MTEETPKTFSIDLASLKSRHKDGSPAAVDRVDSAAALHGFVNREPPKKRGRALSPRVGQLHAKVLPNVSEEIADEAKRRGVQQGVIIEEAWALYKKR
jgi:hypothetical protein